MALIQWVIRTSAECRRALPASTLPNTETNSAISGDHTTATLYWHSDPQPQGSATTKSLLAWLPVRIACAFHADFVRPAADIEDSRIGLVDYVWGVFDYHDPAIGVAGHRINRHLPQVAVGDQISQRSRRLLFVVGVFLDHRPQGE